MIALQLLAVILAGVLDRIRGDAWHFLNQRMVDKAVYGYCMATVAGYALDPIIAPLITITMMIGMSWGWGSPLGAALNNHHMNPTEAEWWQVGPLKTSPWLALAFRGAMWGAPVALVGLLAPSLIWFIPAYAIAFPLSAFIASRLPINDAWAASELIRGWAAASIVLAGSLL